MSALISPTSILFGHSGSGSCPAASPTVSPNCLGLCSHSWHQPVFIGIVLWSFFDLIKRREPNDHPLPCCDLIQSRILAALFTPRRVLCFGRPHSVNCKRERRYNISTPSLVVVAVINVSHNHVPPTSLKRLQTVNRLQHYHTVFFIVLNLKFGSWCEICRHIFFVQRWPNQYLY